MITFTKLNDEWLVRMQRSPVPFREGQTVNVNLRNGRTKEVTLGAFAMLSGEFQFWRVAPPAARATENVGDLSAIIALFAAAKRHLRFPAIVLDGFRVNVAGERARQPGSLTVTSVDKGYDNRRKWFGRVTLAGVFEPAPAADPAIGAKLRAFAADPAGQAAEYGRLHGVCCFCNKPLRDERSTAVGYGRTCAAHYAMPWGCTEAVAA